MLTRAQPNRTRFEMRVLSESSKDKQVVRPTSEKKTARSSAFSLSRGRLTPSTRRITQRARPSRSYFLAHSSTWLWFAWLLAKTPVSFLWFWVWLWQEHTRFFLPLKWQPSMPSSQMVPRLQSSEQPPTQLLDLIPAFRSTFSFAYLPAILWWVAPLSFRRTRDKWVQAQLGQWAYFRSRRIIIQAEAMTIVKTIVANCDSKNIQWNCTHVLSILRKRKGVTCAHTELLV